MAFVEDGPMPFLPVAAQFIAESGPLKQFHQALRLAAPPGFTQAQASAALARLIAHHGSLRLRLAGAGEGGGLTPAVTPPLTQP